MMTDGFANELWARDIDVNSLVPGPTATATFQNADPSEAKSPEDFLAQGSDALPKGLPAWERVKHPDGVAQMALHMADQPGRFIHSRGTRCKSITAGHLCG